MSLKPWKTRTLGAALVAGAIFAVPGAATATTPVGDPSVGTVKAHVNLSLGALAKVEALVEAGKDGRALKVFLKSRAEIGRARADVATMLKTATSTGDTVDAATALSLVADLQLGNIPNILAMLDEVEGKVEAALAKAALADAQARNRAVDVLQVLLTTVPEEARGVISELISKLISDEGAGVGLQVDLLADMELTAPIMRLVTRTLDTVLDGQARGAGIMSQLLPLLPEDAQQALTEALDLVKQQQEAAFELLNTVLDTVPIPPFVRNIVDGIIEQTQSLLNGLFGVIVSPTDSTGEVSTPSTPSAPSPVVPGLGGVIPNIGGLIPDVGALLGGVLDPSKLVGSLLPGGLNPFDILRNLLGGIQVPTGGTGGLFG
jgi:hypothetical protein